MKTNVIVLMGMLLSLSLTSCSKNEVPNEELLVIEETIVDNGDCAAPATVLTEWSIELGSSSTSPEVFTLRHTSALAQMAITGNHDGLQSEFCDRGATFERVPADIDPEHDRGFGSGLAPQVGYGDYIVAMYHPRPDFPDHFLIYNRINGSWARYDLGADEAGIEVSGGKVSINAYYALKPFEYTQPRLVRSGGGFKTGN